MNLPKLSASNILSIADEYRESNYITSLDKAELARHFGGGSLNPDCDDLGLVGDQNWLMGYKYLNRAFRQLFGLYTGDAGIVDIRVKHAVSPDRRRLVERVANRRVNQVIRESGRFRSQYWATCGDAVIYGSPYLYRWNKYDWCPQYAGTPLMPRNAPADVGDPSFVRWVFPSELTGRDIMAQLKRVERGGKSVSWNRGALRVALAQLTKEMHPEAEHVYTVDFGEDDPEEIEYRLQTHSVLENVLGSSVKVYYFFQKDHEGKIDTYIVNRMSERTHAALSDNDASLRITREGDGDGLLFFERARFGSVRECLWPMILDAKFGGKPMAHRVLGLGRLNYDLDRKVSELINTGFAGLSDDMTPLYQAGDIGAMTKLEQMIQHGLRRGSVLPPDVTAFERPTNQRNYTNLFTFMGAMDVAQGSNAAAHAATTGGRGANELEVVALERQQENQQNVTARMEDWVDMGRPMAEAIVTTLCGRGTMVRGDRGWAERERLTELLEEDGVLLEELDPSLLTVGIRKHLGAGDNALRIQRADRKMAVRHLYGPEAQSTILREWSEAVDDSFERASELVPESPQPNRSQVEVAQLQTALALATGVAPAVNGTDMPLIHAMEHLQAAVGVIQTSQGGLDPSATNGMSALLEHTQADIQMIAIAGDEQRAEAFMQQLKQIAKAAQEMASPPPAPREQVEMEMRRRQQELQETKHRDAMEKFKVQQVERQSVNDENLNAKLQSLALQERKLALEEEQEMSRRKGVNV